LAFLHPDPASELKPDMIRIRLRNIKNPQKYFYKVMQFLFMFFYFVDPAGPSLVRPQPVTEQSLMESVAGR
jgi:hypothetical protein